MTLSGAPREQITGQIIQQRPPHAGPEFQLLVALCAMQIPGASRTSQSPEPASTIDWDCFLSVVEWHRVAGIMNRSLTSLQPSIVPAPVAAAIARSAATGAERSIKATMRLAQIVRMFDADSIPVAVLKGVPLSLQLFGDIGVRDSRDIDILVPRRDALRADQRLIAMGYTRIWPEAHETSAYLNEFLARRVHFEYAHAANGQKVELHWRLWESAELGPRECDPSAWEVFRLQGLTLRILPQDLLLPYLCVHGAKHAWFRMKWLLDVACLLQTTPSAADDLMRTAVDWTSTVPAVQALQLSHTLFATPLPPSARRPDLYARTVTRMAMTALTTGGLPETPRQMYIASKRQQLARLLLSRRPRYLLRESWEWLVDLGGWERYSNRQRAMRFLLWMPRWAARRIGMMLSS